MSGRPSDRFAARACPARPPAARWTSNPPNTPAAADESRTDFARAAPIPQFENRFAMPDAASGGARPLNNERRTVWDHVMNKVQFG